MEPEIMKCNTTAQGKETIGSSTKDVLLFVVKIRLLNEDTHQKRNPIYQYH
jgi:hypothetical protein